MSEKVFQFSDDQIYQLLRNVKEEDRIPILEQIAAILRGWA